MPPNRWTLRAAVKRHPVLWLLASVVLTTVFVQIYNGVATHIANSGSSGLYVYDVKMIPLFYPLLFVPAVALVALGLKLRLDRTHPRTDGATEPLQWNLLFSLFFGYCTFVAMVSIAVWYREAAVLGGRNSGPAFQIAEFFGRAVFSYLVATAAAAISHGFMMTWTRTNEALLTSLSGRPGATVAARPWFGGEDLEAARADVVARLVVGQANSIEGAVNLAYYFEHWHARFEQFGWVVTMAVEAGTFGIVGPFIGQTAGQASAVSGAFSEPEACQWRLHRKLAGLGSWLATSLRLMIRR